MPEPMTPSDWAAGSTSTQRQVGSEETPAMATTLRWLWIPNTHAPVALRADRLPPAPDLPAAAALSAFHQAGLTEGAWASARDSQRISRSEGAQEEVMKTLP